ncbi:MAG: hypothetical protein PF501_02850 [Salinisphaera sp.]|nr:hypothetical protein [Salinisphaera sp.]
MFDTVKRRVGLLARPLRRDDRSQASPRSTRICLQLPNPYGGRPWLSATLAVSSVPRGYGQLLRLSAHVDGCMTLPENAADRAALAHDQRDRPSLVGQGSRVAVMAMRQLIERLPSERMSRLGRRRWRSWLDLQVSTAPLDGGAQALMPRALRALYADGLSRLAPGQPRVGVWSGPAGGPGGGIARLAMIQIDEDDIRRGQRGGDSDRFNLNMSLAQLVEPVVPGKGVDGDSDKG